MRGFLKKGICLTMAAGLAAIPLAGCQSGTDSVSDTQGGSEAASGTNTSTGSEAGAMGRYLEEDAALPEGTAMILDICRQTDGSVNMAISNEAGSREIWNSKDVGKTWEKVSDFPADILNDDVAYLYHMALSPDGAIGAVKYSEDGSFQPLYADKDGNVKVFDQLFGGAEANAQANLSDVSFTEDGKLLAVGSKGVFLIDTEKGTVAQEFAKGTSPITIGTAGNVLLVVTTDEVQLYDITTGKLMDKDKVLDEQIVGKDSPGQLEGSSSTKSVLFQKGKEGESVYYCNSNGFYSHTIGGSIAEQIMNGELNSLGSPSTGLVSMASMDDDSFLVACMDRSEYKLLRYVYSKDTPAVPSNEIKAYTLRDNPEIRQAIALFQKKYPDTCVTLEVGLSGDDAVNTSDALRTLNTNILAGKGPDLLLLDGMPIQSYIEKGILTDLGSVLEPISSEEGFIENIKNTYESDGKIYAVPSRFQIPAIQSTKETVDAAVDLKSLADQAEKMKNEKSYMRVLSQMSMVDLALEPLYNVSSPAWEKEDGTLDKDALTEFVTQFKRLYDLEDHSQDQVDTYVEEDIKNSTASSFLSVSMGSMGRMDDSMGISIGNIMSMNDLAMVVSSIKQINGETYGLLNGQSKNVYVPGTVIGISSKSTAPEQAGKFASFLLSKESQIVNQGGGFPVNKAAFDTVINDKPAKGLGSLSSGSSQTGEMVSLDIEWPTDEEINTFKGFVESLDKGPLSDNVIKETVFEQVKRCVKDNVSVEDAVNTILQKVNLYISER
ncbi:extracellular solute-binding protein [Robinsoniella peoriensis]|uniref:extracellular solute-binding protein n=1 Tax=Robinsoniella peoriensis TaxID=180332 RepID=UPI003750306F